MTVEPLLLGLSVGLACVASCGAVLMPWLVARQRGLAASAWLLTQVLAGRLAGYLLFALAAWAVGLVLVPTGLRQRALLFGLTHLGLAGLLVWEILPAATPPPLAHPGDVGRRPWGWRRRLARMGPAALGLLTGLNVCPPFVVAAVRAAELRSLPSSLAFFAVFFVGTSVWFLPFLAVGALRPVPQARVIARVAMGVVAGYYAYTGAVTLGWRLFHG